MATKSKQTYYFAIKGKASTFFDPTSGLQVHDHTPGKFTGKLTDKIRKAMLGGHISQINETEYNALVNKIKEIESDPAPSKEVEPKAPEEVNLSALSMDALRTMASKLDGITEAQLKKAKGMKKDDLIEFIEEFQSQEEEDEDEDEDEDDDQ